MKYGTVYAGHNKKRQKEKKIIWIEKEVKGKFDIIRRINQQNINWLGIQDDKTVNKV